MAVSSMLAQVSLAPSRKVAPERGARVNARNRGSSRFGTLDTAWSIALLVATRDSGPGVSPGASADRVRSADSMPSNSGATLVEGSTLGRYTITRLVGEGGMGAVYEAKHQDLGKRVAIKTLHPHHAASSDVRARFVREGQAASRIRHQHVVDVYDVAVEGDMPYLVMEFLEGEDVAKLVAREGALPVERAVDLLLPAVSAVAAANELGIVHRDLKPENVFLCIERGVIRPRVVDFGISKLVDKDATSALTATDAFLGTPFYMSPEQAQGAKFVDARTDQYALGVIVYECVTGRRPFEDPTLYKLMHKIVTGDFPPPRALEPTLPEGLQAIILKAMAKEPSQRFESTRAFGAALVEFARAHTRAIFWHEFGEGAETLVDQRLETARSNAPSSPPDQAHTSTLGQSAHQLDRQAPARGRAFALLAPVVVGASIAGFFWLRSPARSSAPSAAPPLPQPAAVATTLPAQSSPLAPSSESSPAAPARKRVQSVPPGALLAAGGHELGSTPQALDVPAGGVDIELRHDGYETLERRLEPEDPAELTLELVPRARKNAGTKSATEHVSKPSTPGIPKLAPR